MNNYVGECVGGPEDGVMCAHWSSSFGLYGLDPENISPEGEPLAERTFLGEYRWDSGKWVWEGAEDE